VSPYEEVAATFCDQCQHVVTVLHELVDAPRPMAQAPLQMNALGRLRRVEVVSQELIRRRILSARMVNASWADIGDALGMTGDEAKNRYPLRRAADDNGGSS
jgi:hypothetical protein